MVHLPTDITLSTTPTHKDTHSGSLPKIGSKYLFPFLPAILIPRTRWNFASCSTVLDNCLLRDPFIYLFVWVNVDVTLDALPVPCWPSCFRSSTSACTWDTCTPRNISSCLDTESIPRLSVVPAKKHNRKPDLSNT